MTDIIMTWLLRLFCWGLPIGLLAFIAWTIAARIAKSRRAAAGLFAVLLAAECGLCCWAAYHPIVSIPEKYAPYISREEAAGASRGFYSRNIPAFPVFVEVVRADSAGALVRTYYCPFGTTEHSVSADGYNLEKPLFPAS